MTLLRNGSFEEWGEGDTLVLPVSGDPYLVTWDNVQVAAPWTPWYVHQEQVWDKPESKPVMSPERIQHGSVAACFFTFYRNHWGGHKQQVNVPVGATVRLSASAHAWSSTKIEGYESWNDNPHWSVGAGDQAFAAKHEDLMPRTGHPYTDGLHNFHFRIGIDPTGNNDPLAATVVWSDDWAIYNEYHQLSLDATAQGGVVTVFLQSKTTWPFKHNDAYWDDASLEVISEPEPPEPEPDCRGKPRIQYERTYNVIPANATDQDAINIFFEGWLRGRESAGGSYDDAGIGDLDVRKVLLHGIPVTGVDALRDFYDEHYPGCDLTFVGVVEPPDPEPPTEPQYPDPGQLISLHSQAGWRGDLEFIRAVKPSTYKLVLGMERAWDVKAASPNTKVVYRPYASHQSQYLYHADGVYAGAQAYIDTFADSLEQMRGGIDYVESLNEEVPTHNLDKLALLVQFERAFCALMAAQFPWVKVVILTAAVGNPDHDEVIWMLPAVWACVAVNGALGYHAYWNVHNQESELVQDWYHHAGRALESWDPVFREAGLYPRYIFGECGAVEDMKPNDGWKVAYNLEKYLDDVLLFRSMMTAWNAEHGNRVIGATLFTLGGGDVWREFEQGQILGELAAALT